MFDISEPKSSKFNLTRGQSLKNKFQINIYAEYQ